MNLRLSKVVKERLAPHGNLLASIGTALGSAYHFLRGNPRMGTDLANISVLTFKTWLLPYIEEGKNINYWSIFWNAFDSIIMEGASQLWGVPTYRATHAITAVETLVNSIELYRKRNSSISSVEKTVEHPNTNYFNHPTETGRSWPGFLTSKLYI